MQIYREEMLEEPVRIQTPSDPFCVAIRDYCRERSVALVLKSLCERVPEAVPNYRGWRTSDPVPLIYKKIQEPGYVEDLLPTLEMLLASNFRNSRWAAQVLIAITLFKVIEELAQESKSGV